MPARRLPYEVPAAKTGEGPGGEARALPNLATPFMSGGMTQVALEALLEMLAEGDDAGGASAV